MRWSASVLVLFCKQKTAYEMRISDWSSDVCSSDLPVTAGALTAAVLFIAERAETLVGIWGLGLAPTGERDPLGLRRAALGLIRDRKSVVEGKSGSVRVDLGGRRIIKQKPSPRAATALQTAYITRQEQTTDPE